MSERAKLARAGLAVTLLAATASAVAAAGPAAAAPARAPASAASAPTAYVTITGTQKVAGHTVTPVNTATNKPGKPIDVGKDPGPIAVTPNGKTAYRGSRSRSASPLGRSPSRPTARPSTWSITGRTR